MVRGHQRKTTGSQNYRLSVLHIQARDTTDHHQLFIRRVIVPRDQAPRRQLTNDDGCPLAGIAAQHSARCARRHTWDGFELYLSDVSSLRMTGRLLPSRDWRQSRGQWGNKHQRVHQSSGAHICPPIRSMAAQTEVMSGVRCSARFWPSLMAALVINVVSSASRAFPPFPRFPTYRCSSSQSRRPSSRRTASAFNARRPHSTSFVTAADGHGGTLITEAAQTANQ